ncbi:MAG: hypothetical protein GEU99_13345 [Luteitalea sp.]|nr:hypothetical protein [Luteitalea sp.]
MTEGRTPSVVGAGISPNDERVQAIAKIGFTERQARFLLLVMRHAGVCVPRQYATFAGIANGGKKCNALFAKLVRRRFAAAIPCVHNRARLYHVHARGLYGAIGEGASRYRRPVPAGRIAERLMRLDAVLSTPDLDWLTTAGEKRTCLARLTTSASPEPASDRVADSASASVRDLPSTFPIGVESSGRVVLLYLVTEPWTEPFRTFLQRHAALLRVSRRWTVRLAFPRPLDHFYSTYQAVIREELESPLHPITISELRWYFDHRRQADDGQPLHPQTQGFVSVGARVFGAPRFTEMYRRWRRHGDVVFEGISSPAIAEALEAGRGSVECLVLPHGYRHLSPLVADAPSMPERVGQELRRGPSPRTRGPHALNPRPQPPAETPQSVSEQLDRAWHRLNEFYKAQKAQGVRP